MKKIPKKYSYEVLVAAGFLTVIAILVSVISPATLQKNFILADSNSANTSLVYGAKVVSVSQDIIEVTLEDGPNKGGAIFVPLTITNGKNIPKPQSTILVTNNIQTGGLAFYDLYRIPLLVVIVTVFVLVVLLIGRRKGARSLIGLGASVIVIGWVIVPLVIAGYNSLLVSVLGAYLIAIVSILIAHGFKRRTFISLFCILVVLILVTIGSQLAVAILGLTGVTDEVSYYLQEDFPKLDLGGILVGGIVIAALGALDDIVTTQIATVDELKKANKTLGIKELYKRASSVGSEHIAALVNTLALVYVGAALPLIVAYSISSPELFSLFNSEFIVTEILRTVIVSIGLVLAVPISTYISAILLTKHYDNLKI